MRKKLENPNDLTSDKLAHMVKWIEEVMRLSRKSNKNEEFGKGKWTNRSFKENDNKISKGKKI